MTTIDRPITATLEVPGATLTYDVRGDLQSGTPLLLVGSPMDANGFAALATQFSDRPVVTYDPRGVMRSPRDTPGLSTPELHADDLHRLIDAFGVGPVDLFGSSGGAVNGLALVTVHPEQVRTLIAHEPPACPLLPDHSVIKAVIDDIDASYQRSGMGPAMAKFAMMLSQTGPLEPSYLAVPAPDPSMFGMSTEDDGSRDDALLSQNLQSCTGYEPDFGALAQASTRIAIGAGRESTGEVSARAAAEVAKRLGVELTMFPGGHAGFTGDGYGTPGDPEGFAAVLREILG
ncbi:alpha/beta hydrolase [Rhodococcus sp. HNM0563]|uniref:alpha/beta fold hydrolase n=1 Tax=Rhodococcus sp. HNM0563 TaxID=2716339 RepID=UPI00146F44CA|nr:alpha/beta hydrolase [Rhodococcus sp. HNM0563]NLU61663.1 alpha/beta hydrolase [Rhodococcus sp. HNM0563]